MKHNITIKMGASKFTASVRGPDGNVMLFDLYRASAKQQHEFRRTLVQAWQQQRA